MAVVLIKAQFRAGPGRAEVSGVILAVMVAAATNARQIPVPVPDKLVESVLCLLDEVTQGLHCYPALGLPLAIGSFFLQTALFLFPLLLGFGSIVGGLTVYAGAFIRAHVLLGPDRVKPFTAYGAFAAGRITHYSPLQTH